MPNKSMPDFYIETFGEMDNPHLKFAQLGYDKCAPGASFSHFREFYIIQVIKKGKGVVETNGQTFKLKANDAFIVKPNELLAHKADQKDPWELLFFAFGGELAKTLFEKTVFNKRLYVSLNNNTAIDTLDQFISQVRDDNTHDILNYSRLFTLLSLFESTKKRKIAPTLETRKISGDDIVELVKGYIKSNYPKPIKISDIAKQLNLNRSHLYRVFKQQTNMDIATYLTMTRINQACHLIKTTNFPINTIAQLVGYPYYPNFFNHFKENIGTTPTKYRNG